MHRGKKRRNIIIISLVGIMLCMVVGYAAFSTNLSITGTSKVTSSWDIRITDVTNGEATGDAENAKAPDWDTLSASFEANLYSKGDAMEYDVTIENKGTLDAKLDNIITNAENANSEAVIITFTGYKKGEVLEAGTSKQVHVKIAYNPNYDGGETSGEVNVDFDFKQENEDPSQPSTYMLTYDFTTNGGSRADSEGEFLPSGSNVNLSIKAYKDGWTFVGWNTDKNAKTGMTSYQMEEKAVTLYAIYSKTLSVTYQKGDNVQNIGKNSDACTMYNNATSCNITLPPITANEGYTVEGWYSGNNKKGNPNATYALTQNMTLTAKVKQNMHTVTYDYKTNGGTSVTKESDSVGYGDNIDLSPVATKEGWTFVGWNTDKNAKAALTSLKMGNENVTLYAIYKKEAKTVTITFNKNGAASQTPNGGNANTNNTLTQSCTIPAVYNNETQGTSCEITSPKINPSSNTPTVVGYNTSSSATTSTWNEETKKSVSSNATYYAITKSNTKTIKVTFEKNGAASIGAEELSCVIPSSYNGAAQSTSCAINAPAITGSSNTPTVIGWSTSANNHTNEWTVGEAKNISANATYYAQTTKPARDITITFNQNGAQAIGATSKKCTIAASYNGQAQAANCSVTSPTITAPSNTPTVIGWSTAADRHQNDWTANSAKNVSENATYYAQTKKNAVTHTITFNNNGATLSSNEESCTIGETYNGTAQGTTCSVTSPTITPASGFAAVGFNTNKSATTSTWNQNTAKTISANATYYAITKSSSNLTATFNKNGATSIGADTLSCTRYNGASSCNVTAPSITRSGFTITGWGESASSTTAVAKVGANISLSANKTFYAVTSKKITLTFNKGANVSQIGATSGSCTIQNSATNCQVTLPSITPNNGYTSIGWNTTSGATTGTAAGQKITVSANGTYYANAVDKTGPTKPAITNSSNGNWTANNVTITVTSTDAGSGIDHYEWYENGAWTTRALNTENGVGTITFTADRNETIQFRAIDKAGNISEVSTTPVKIDTKNPSVSISTTSSTTNSITVVANASAASGITKYEYSIDGGNWVTGTSNTYTFTNVTSGNHTVSVRVTSGVGKQASASATKSTVTLSAPNFEEEGTTSKTVTITYPSGCGSTLTCTYQKDNGTVQTVTSQTVEVPFTNSGSLKAIVTDGTNTQTSSYTVKVGRTVTYNYSQNGGTSATKTSAVVEEGDAIDLTPTATKSGWTFVGWNTNKDATTKLSSLNMGSSNVTLYAIYRKEAKTVTITFNKNGATSQTPSGGAANTGTSLTQKCTIPAVYNNATQATTCSITSPKITAPSATPTVIGYNTSASATSSSWNQNTAKGVSSNATYYAITRKDAVTLTAKFNANGATLSSTSNLTCQLAATYNGKAQATSCNVTAPTITRSGYTIIGYNTSAGSTSNNGSYNTSSRALTLTSSNNNSTWYAVTRKTVTITFDKNGAQAIGSTSQSCNMYNTAANCSITSPSITAPSNTPAVIGWSTAADRHSNDWTAESAKSVSANDTYYAQTQKGAVTRTITFNKNGAASQTPNGGSANTNNTLTQSCTIGATYNGTAQGTSCSITSPTINPASGFTVIGYSTAAGTHSSSWNQKTAKSVSANATYYAQTQKAGKTVTITFNKNGAASQTPSGGNANSNATLTQSCSIATVYNGASQATTCNITSPTINPASGFTVIGCSTAAGTHSSAWNQATAKGVSSNATYYAQTQKAGKTLTAKFNANGASLSSTSDLTCNIAAVYNGASQATSCTVTAPSITRSGYSIIGYNTSSGSTSNSGSYNTSNRVLTLTGNNTWYAVTRKTVTITFDKNGASAIGATSKTCNMYNTAANCSITSPTITAASNFSVIGWSTAAGTHSNQWSANTAKSVSANDTYYAQTQRAGKTITITFDKNGASAIGATSKNCSIPTVYNGATQATTCSITSPTITPSTNTPTVIGWSTAADRHSNDWTAESAKSVSANDTYYAQTKKAAVTRTITFNKNGATSQTPNGGSANSNATLTQSCTIGETYNGTAQGTSCNITSPTINPASGFTVIGYNTSSGATTSSWNQKTAKSISANATYYAVTKSSAQYTATFNANGATIGATSKSCYRYNGASSCSITTPTITRSGFTITGWGTSASATTAAVGANASLSLSSNPTYYAVTSKTVTVSYTKGTNVSAIGATSNSCTIRNSATNCQVTLPSITAASTYVANGWFSGSTKVGNAGDKYTVSNNVTLASQAVADNVTASVSASNKTTNSITAVANASATSGISRYEFSKDGGSTWVNNGTSNTYKFTGLTDGTAYKIRVRVTAASGKQVTSSTVSVTTSTVPKPTFTQSGVYPVTVKITFPSGCGSTYTCSYKKNNGTSVNVTSTTANVSFDNHGSVTATVTDGTNTENPAYTVTIKLKAADLSYSNASTGLNCTDAQCALDKIKEMLDA